LKSIPDLEVVDGKVKRIKPVPDTFDYKARADCTVLLRGFPKSDTMVTIDEIQDLMAPYGNPLSIFRKRKYQTKEFTGKVLVQFSTPEETKTVLEIKEIPYKEGKLSIMTQEQYYQIKSEELAKLGIVYKRPVFQKRQKEKSENTRNSKKQKKETPVVKQEIGIIKGVLVEVKNVPQGISLVDLKAYFARFGSVQFIDLSKIEQGIIIVRFTTPEETNVAFGEISEKKMEIKGNILDARMVTGEEEEKYWNEEIIPQFIRTQTKMRNQRQKVPSKKQKKNKRQKTTSNPSDTKEKEIENPVNEFGLGISEGNVSLFSSASRNIRAF